MHISVDLYDAKPAYLQITDSVREAIALGSLKPGDRLPPIREAATQTRVNRNTVSRAYLELEHQGLVQARQGSGFFVTQGSSNEERTARRKLVERKIAELLTESRLAQLTTKELVALVQSAASARDQDSSGS